MNEEIIVMLLKVIYPVIRPDMVDAAQRSETKIDDRAIGLLDLLLGQSQMANRLLETVKKAAG